MPAAAFRRASVKFAGLYIPVSFFTYRYGNAHMKLCGCFGGCLRRMRPQFLAQFAKAAKNAYMVIAFKAARRAFPPGRKFAFNPNK